MTKFLTINETVKAVKERDAKTAINRYMISTLIGEGVMHYEKIGNRVILNRDTFMSDLCKMLEINRQEFINLRSINEALPELGKRGISKSSIRELIKTGNMKYISVGNRAYIALEQLDSIDIEILYERRAPDPTSVEARKKHQELMKEYYNTNRQRTEPDFSSFRRR